MIADWFNGQPFYLQCYCSELVKALKKQNFITKAIAVKVKDLMLESKDISFFDNLVHRDDKDGIDLAYNIAKVSGLAGNYVAVDKLRLNALQLDKLETLSKRGVIQYKKAEKKCRIVIPFFNEWLINH